MCSNIFNLRNPPLNTFPKKFPTNFQINILKFQPAKLSEIPETLKTLVSREFKDLNFTYFEFYKYD